MAKIMHSVDINKLEILLMKKGSSTIEASRAMGYNHNYLRENPAKTGKRSISNQAAVMLKMLYNISPEDYAIEKQEVKQETKEDVQEPEEKEETTEIATTEFTINELTMKQLGDVIYNAVYKATLAALKSI